MTTKTIPLAVLLIAAAPLLSPAISHARSKKSVQRDPAEQMLKLAPSARVEQRCNARAMGDVGREHPGMRPDELVAYAFADPQIDGATVKAPGAAVRSRGTWYRLSYDCETADEGLTIRSFKYVLGEPVPKKDWAEHYLVEP